MKKIILSFAGLAAVSIFILSAQAVSVQADTASSCITLSHNLRYQTNDAVTGGDVTRLQTLLIAKGYLNTTASGYFGALTLAAVKKYQVASGVDATGYVGPLTRTSINNSQCTVSPAHPINPLSPPITSSTTPVAATNSCRLVITSPYLNQQLTNGGSQTVTWYSSTVCTATTSVMAVLKNTSGSQTWNISLPSGGALASADVLGLNFSGIAGLSSGLYQVALETTDTQQILSPFVQINLDAPAQGAVVPSISYLSASSVPDDGMTQLTITGSNLTSSSWVYLGGLNGKKIKPISVDASGGNLVITVPQSIGIAYYQLGVSNDGSNLSNQVNVSVTGPVVSRYSILTTAIPAASVGQSYITGIQATGFLNNYTWSLLSGTLPAGLTLVTNPNGYLAPASISGVPQVAGQYTFTVQAIDTAGNTAKQALTLNVAADPNASSKIPEIYALSTYSSATGTAVTINGARFNATKNYVLFNDRVAAGPIASSDGNSFTFTVPAITSPNCNLFSNVGACPMNLLVLTPNIYTITVETANGTSNSTNFTLLPPANN